METLVCIVSQDCINHVDVIIWKNVLSIEFIQRSAMAVFLYV